MQEDTLFRAAERAPAPARGAPLALTAADPGRAAFAVASGARA
jgi:hypothetical protein